MGRDATDHVRFLADFCHRLAGSTDFEATLLRALEGIAQHLDAASGAAFLLDDDGWLVCHAAVGSLDLRGFRLPPGDEVVGGCLRAGHAQIAGAATIVVTTSTGPRSIPVRSVLSAPLVVAGRPLGAVAVLDRRDDRDFEPSDGTVLTALSGTAALALANARLLEAEAEQKEVNVELDLAAEIQSSLLPSPDPDHLPVVGINRAIRRVSGDFFDFFRLDDGHIPFTLGDVAGKGMNAALLMAKTVSLFRCLGKSVHDPAALLAIINNEICETASRGMFVTMVAGIYDPWSGRLRFANAGHQPPLLRRVDRSYQTFPAAAPPLGILPGIGFGAHEIKLDGGEFYVFTDGLTEYRYGGREELGVEGLIQLVEVASDKPLYDRLCDLLAELDHAGWELRDDLTVLAVDGAWVQPGGDVSRRLIVRSDGSPDMLLELRFPAQADRLRAIRGSVRAAARSCGFDEAASQDIVLAVNEACQNVIQHAYRDDPDGEIVIEIYRREDGVLLRLRDFAPTVDPASVQPRPLDELRPGGLGTHFIREIMDSVEFVPIADGRGNLLEMVKRNEGAADDRHR